MPMPLQAKMALPKRSSETEGATCTADAGGVHAELTAVGSAVGQEGLGENARTAAVAHAGGPRDHVAAIRGAGDIQLRLAVQGGRVDLHLVAHARAIWRQSAARRRAQPPEAAVWPAQAIT